jgi:hypothetical protein
MTNVLRVAKRSMPSCLLGRAGSSLARPVAKAKLKALAPGHATDAVREFRRPRPRARTNAARTAQPSSRWGVGAPDRIERSHSCSDLQARASAERRILSYARPGAPVLNNAPFRRWGPCSAGRWRRGRELPSRRRPQVRRRLGVEDATARPSCRRRIGDQESRRGAREQSARRVDNRRFGKRYASAKGDDPPLCPYGPGRRRDGPVIGDS